MSFWLSLGMALGMAASAPLIAPFITVRDRARRLARGRWREPVERGARGDRRSDGGGASALGLIDQLGGRRPDRVPDQLYAASAARLIKICEQNPRNWGQAREACQKQPGYAGVLRPQDISTRGAFLLTALPPLGGFGAAAAGLVWAAVAALGAALAAVEPAHRVRRARQRRHPSPARQVRTDQPAPRHRARDPDRPASPPARWSAARANSIRAR